MAFGDVLKRSIDRRLAAHARLLHTALHLGCVRMMQSAQLSIILITSSKASLQHSFWPRPFYKQVTCVLLPLGHACACPRYMPHAAILHKHSHMCCRISLFHALWHRTMSTMLGT
jgi:hypothetical protein